jgi:hypothetical protein
MIRLTEVDKMLPQMADGFENEDKNSFKACKSTYSLENNRLFLPAYGQDSLQEITNNGRYFFAHYGIVWHNAYLSFQSNTHLF